VHACAPGQRRVCIAVPGRSKVASKTCQTHLKTVGAPLLQLHTITRGAMLTLDSPAPISNRQHTPRNTKPRTRTAPLRLDTVHACAPGRRRVCIAVPGRSKVASKTCQTHLKTVGAPLLLLQAIIKGGMLTLDSPARILWRPDRGEGAGAPGRAVEGYSPPGLRLLSSAWRRFFFPRGCWKTFMGAQNDESKTVSADIYFSLSSSLPLLPLLPSLPPPPLA
jgi:hypothetical protein